MHPLVMLRVSAPEGEVVHIATDAMFVAVEASGYPYEIRRAEQAVYYRNKIIGWIGKPIASFAGAK
jgi:hypothetical protein